jgi:hypothetical protein
MLNLNKWRPTMRNIFEFCFEAAAYTTAMATLYVLIYAFLGGF